MADQNNKNVDALAQEITLKSRGQGKLRQFILWMGALIIGAILGWQHIPALNELFNFIAAVFTRLFQFIAIPTVSLAVITTLSMLGAKKRYRPYLWTCCSIHIAYYNLCSSCGPWFIPMDCAR